VSRGRGTPHNPSYFRMLRNSTYTLFSCITLDVHQIWVRRSAKPFSRPGPCAYAVALLPKLQGFPPSGSWNRLVMLLSSFRPNQGAPGPNHCWPPAAHNWGCQGDSAVLGITRQKVPVSDKRWIRWIKKAIAAKHQWISSTSLPHHHPILSIYFLLVNSLNSKNIIISRKVIHLIHPGVVRGW